MKPILFFILILASTDILGQRNESLLISASNKEIKDGFCIYEVSVQNKSDSIACLLHSIFVDLTVDIPQGLPLYIKNKSREEYSLHRSFEDTTYDAEAMPRKGEFILPHQTLKFRVKILTSESIDDVPKYLTIQYFYLADMCYADFKSQMKEKVGSWYFKYNRLKESIKL